MSGASAPRNMIGAASMGDDVLSALRERCSWTLVRKALKNAHLPVGQGWADVGESAVANNPGGAKMHQFLWDYYLGHLIAGDRYVQIYDIPQETKPVIFAALKGLAIPRSNFAGFYPLRLPPAQLPSASSTPTLVEVRKLERGDYALVYCSVRSYDDRVRYEFKQLPIQVQQTYALIDQLITVRKVHFQAYDVAVIRAGLSRVEVYIDQPKKGNSDSLDLAVLNVTSELRRNIPLLSQVLDRSPYNVFPAIAGIYFTNGEGTVRSLSFRTLTGSRKHERMIKSDDDLRAEKFHRAGALAVHNKLKPYELTVDWDVKVPRGDIQVTMKASIREVSSPDPRLYGFYVSADSNALIAVGINKVVKYL